MPALQSAQRAENCMTAGIFGQCKGFMLQLPALPCLLCKALGVYFEKMYLVFTKRSCLNQIKKKKGKYTLLYVSPVSTDATTRTLWSTATWSYNWLMFFNQQESVFKRGYNRPICEDPSVPSGPTEASVSKCK